MDRTIAVEVGCRSSGAEDHVKPGCGGPMEKYSADKRILGSSQCANKVEIENQHRCFLSTPTLQNVHDYILTHTQSHTEHVYNNTYTPHTSNLCTQIFTMQTKNL